LLQQDAVVDEDFGMYKHKLSLLKFLQIFIHFIILAFIVVDEVDSLDGLFNMAALQHIFLIIG
jgi:hypothetical protein